MKPLRSVRIPALSLALLGAALAPACKPQPTPTEVASEAVAVGAAEAQASGEAAAALAAARAAAAPAAVSGTALPAGHPPLQGGAVHGGGAAEPQRARGDVVAHGPVGRVLQAEAADRYTYLRLETADGEVWAAVGGDAPAVGSRVAVVEALRMEQFRSAALGRTFEVLWLGRLSGDVAAAERAAAADTPLPSAAAGERPIAEVRASAANLAGQQVRVRGRVRKVTRRVLGKDWVHLVDASTGADGAALVVTTQASVQPGEVVVLEGKLGRDREIGAGYRYDVLLEDAQRIEEPSK